MYRVNTGLTAILGIRYQSDRNAAIIRVLVMTRIAVRLVHLKALDYALRSDSSNLNCGQIGRFRLAQLMSTNLTAILPGSAALAWQYQSDRNALAHLHQCDRNAVTTTNLCVSPA
jgi:hypothetical protein